MDSQEGKRRRRGPYRAYAVDTNIPIPTSTKRRISNQKGSNMIGVSGTSGMDRVSGTVATAHPGVHLQGEGNVHMESDSCETVNIDEDGEIPCDVSLPNFDCEQPDIVSDDREYVDKYADDEGEGDEDHDPGYDANEAPDGSPRPQSTNSQEDTPLYEGARLSLGVSMLLVITFVMKHHLSHEAFCDLLTLIDLHLYVPNIFKKSHKLFVNFLAKLKDPLKKMYYCIKCKNFNRNNCDTCTLPSCGAAIQKDAYMIYIPLKEQLCEKMSEILPIIARYKEQFLSRNDAAIGDVVDGKLYQELFDGAHFRGTDDEQKEKEVHISLQMNTDGVSLFRSRSFSVWPIFLTINEIPPALRFTRSFKLFCGLWFGDSKPIMDVFLRPLCEEVRDLVHKGIDIISPTSHSILRCAILSAVLDAPARCAAQNFIQFNGYYGCGTCLVHGESTKTAKGQKTTFQFDYRPECENKGYKELRTVEHTQAHAFQAEKSKLVFGIKGVSWLLSLVKFDIIRGVGIDYMHTVCLGIMKLLLRMWTDRSFKNEQFSLFDKLHILNRRLSAISIPSRISRLPRTIDQLGNWKASEFRSFCVMGLYVYLGCYYSHFAGFSHAIYLLLQNKISANDLELARQNIVYFCATFSGFYGPEFMTMNVHSLLHLCEKVEDLGPLWAHSCFFYEDLNGDLRSLFHGTQNVETQICHAVCINNNLPALAQQLIPHSVADTLFQKLAGHKKLKSKMEEIGPDLFLVGAPTIWQEDEPHVRNLVMTSLGHPLESAYKFKRISKCNNIIQSAQYAPVSKRNNYTVKYNENGISLYGQVIYYLECVLQLENSTRIVYRAILQTLPLQDTDQQIPKHCFSVSLIHGHKKVIPVENVMEVVAFLQNYDDDTKCFVNVFPNFVERE